MNSILMKNKLLDKRVMLLFLFSVRTFNYKGRKLQVSGQPDLKKILEDQKTILFGTNLL
jgi:hypothetical protein